MPVQPARRGDAIKGIMGSALLALAIGGCAISKDGVGFASRRPDANQIAKARDQLAENAGGESGTARAQPGFLVVGTTGPFRTIDEKQRKDFYRAYLHVASEWHPGEAPTMSPAAFQDKLAGWASIQTFGIPLVMNWRLPVLVPATAVQDTRFASAAGSFVFGTTGDLVVARSDLDGLLWLDRVLCKSGHAYQACAEKYVAGTFDANTGRELGRDKKPKANGEWVDVSSYVRLSKDPDRHTASELDVRAINRCDDCKGSVPGSVQSSVPPPPAQ
jgi:hypothetical protein